MAGSGPCNMQSVTGEGAVGTAPPQGLPSSGPRISLGRESYRRTVRALELGVADSDEAGQVFRFEAGHPYRFEAGHCTEVMSARLRRSSRVGSMMGSALWSGQERAVADSGGDFMLPFGHPFCSTGPPSLRPDLRPWRAAR